MHVVNESSRCFDLTRKFRLFTVIEVFFEPTFQLGLDPSHQRQDLVKAIMKSMCEDFDVFASELALDKQPVSVGGPFQSEQLANTLMALTDFFVGRLPVALLKAGGHFLLILLNAAMGTDVAC